MNDQRQIKGSKVSQAVALSLALAAAAAALPSSGAAAAAAAGADAAAASSAAGQGAPIELQEVVVTAEKRAQNLQKVPLSVIALTGAELQRAGVNSAQGLTGLVPGLEVGNYGSTTTFTMRGITSNTDPNLGDSPTAFHIDGVYQGRPAAASGLFYDIQRIEVLSGPQGTLYGKDSTGGTINVITNKPNFKRVSASITQTFGSYDLYRTTGFLNVPISDTWALRFAFQTLRHKGYLATGYDDADDRAARVNLLWKPSDSFSALLTQDYFHQGGVGQGQVPLAELPGDWWRNDPWSVNLPISQQQFPEAGFTARTNNVSAQTALHLTWNLGFADLISVSAYHHLHLDSTAYLNGTPSLQTETDQEISQEVRLQSVAGAKTQWVGGVYYHKEHQTNYLYFYDQAGPGTDSDQIFPKIDTPSYAAFGQITYPILPRWRVTAGVRANTDKKTIQGSIAQYNWTVVNGPSTIPITFPYVIDRTTPAAPVDCYGNGVLISAVCPQAAPSGSLTSSRATWRVGSDFDLTPTSMVYFNVSTGYKEGGLDAARAPNNVYRPETITAYEVGSKNRFFHNRLQVNADAFYYDYKNYQVDELEWFIGQYGSPVFGDFITNAAAAHHKGVDLETEWLVTSHDRLSLNVSWLDARFTKFNFPLPPNPAGATLDANGNVVTSFEDLSGEREYDAPEWTATLTFQHTWELPNEAQLSFYVQSHFETYYYNFPDHDAESASDAADGPNSPSPAPPVDSRQPSYHRTAVTLQYSSPNDRYEVSAYARNLENAVVVNNYTFQGPPAALVPGTIGPPPFGTGSAAQRNFVSIDPPRTFGVSFTFNF